MKQKFMPKGSIMAALDIGSSKIACFIARVADDAGRFEVLGIGHQASAGIKSGTVVDMAAAEAAIRRTVHAAENRAASAMHGYPLREVIVNVPGIHATSHNFAVEVQTLGHEVTDSDVRRALSRAQDQIRVQADTPGQAPAGIEMAGSHELIHTIPAGYSIDGHNSIREPRGMHGQMLSVDIHLVTGRAAALRNIAACIGQSHLDIAALSLSSYAAGIAALVEDEMNLGCTVIDIGGGVTSFAVFNGGNMVYADAIPLGGQHVTSDIARGLTTGINDAERLKNLYGNAIATSADENELIDVPVVGEERGTHPNHVPRSLLVGIIQPRLEEVLELVRARLQDSGASAAAGRRVVLTGGSSQMPGLRDLAQHVLDKQVRLGRPVRLDGLAEAVSGPAFATTAGLLHYIAEHAHETPSEIATQAEPGTLWERARHWLRENW